MKRFAAAVGTSYGRYQAEASRDKPSIATAIARDFFNVWWDQVQYQESRADFPEPSTRETPLKIEVAKYFDAATSSLPSSGPLAEEMQALREASARGVAAVVTTNYDRVTDLLFPDFTVYRSQDELLMSTPYGGRELFKIHGCVTDPDSMVLTAEDYDDFNSRSPYLSAKLLTLFAEHPVLFLGYSIDDPHIKRLLLDVSRALSATSVAKLAGNLIFVRWDPDRAASDLVESSFAIDGSSVPMHFAEVNDEGFGEVFDALNLLRPKLPTKVVAQLKSEVYRIVQSEEPTEEIYARDIETLDDDANFDELEVVVGIGIRDELGALGFVGITRKHLLDDLVRPNPKLRGAKAAQEVLESVIPQIRVDVYVPVFKYLHRAGMLESTGALRDDVEVSDRVRTRVEAYAARLRPYVAAGRRPRRQAEAFPSIAALRANTTQAETLEALMCLDPSTVDVNDLLDFLQEACESQPEEISTPLARAICFYDFVRFGPGAAV